MTDITLSPSSTNSIQATAAPVIQGLHLVEGQIVNATVQQMTRTSLWLNMNGRTFAARSELPLQVGQQITLTVASIDATHIVLRMLEQARTPSSSSSAGDAAKNLESLLLQWGIEADELNLTIARSLLAHTFKVDPEAIRFIKRQMNLLSSTSYIISDTTHEAQPLSAEQRSDVEAVVHLFANQIPIDQESLETNPAPTRTNPADRFPTFSSSINYRKSFGAIGSIRTLFPLN